MSWYNIIIGVVIILVSISAVIIVLMQESRTAGLSGAIAGGADTFLGKNKGRSVEDKLVKITKYLTIAFFALALISCFFIKPSLSYINWETILLLFVIMLVVEVLKNLAVFEMLVRRLLAKVNDSRALFLFNIHYQ